MNDNTPVNKQTNKQTEKARIEITFWVRATPENLDRLRRAEELAKRDNSEISSLARSLFFEGVERHYPGNPALPLEHWTEGVPLSAAAREKLKGAREPVAGIREFKCLLCGGTGQFHGDRCEECNGQGRYYQGRGVE
jgi:hypothetical protein